MPRRTPAPLSPLVPIWSQDMADYVAYVAKDPINQRGERGRVGRAVVGKEQIFYALDIPWGAEGSTLFLEAGSGSVPWRPHSAPSTLLHRVCCDSTIPLPAPMLACHILECCEAQSVISTVGQAFELRFKQYLHSPPKVVVPPERMTGTEESAWGEEDEPAEHDYYNSIPGKEPPLGGLVDSRLRPSGHGHTQPPGSGSFGQLGSPARRDQSTHPALHWDLSLHGQTCDGYLNADSRALGLRDYEEHMYVNTQSWEVEARASEESPKKDLFDMSMPAPSGRGRGGEKVSLGGVSWESVAHMPSPPLPATSKAIPDTPSSSPNVMPHSFRAGTGRRGEHTRELFSCPSPQCLVPAGGRKRELWRVKENNDNNNVIC
uniref:PID domain-containing protein n=1 Tax=Ornithorhynchus anatinus TaxID=9258 RepID=A0A6I8NME1_ORNAN